LIQIDVAYVFQRLGGPKGVLGALDQYLPGHGLNYPAVQMWKQRNRVSCTWLPTLVYLLHREGFALGPCFVDDAEFEFADDEG
jgi:hypothetical protein